MIRRLAILGALALLGDRPARAEPPFGAALVAHVEQLIIQMRPQGELRVDPRLERSLDLMVGHLPPSGPPPNDLVEAALWLNGVVEPVPQLVVVTTQDDSSATRGTLPADSLDDELRRQLPSVLHGGHFRFVAAAAAREGGGARVVIALQESFVQLSGTVRALPMGGVMHLRGKLLAPYSHVEGFATLSTGQVTRLPIKGDAAHFAADFRCATQGRQQIELTGEERFGPQVVANFPLYCGEEAPSLLPPALPAERRVQSHEEAELALFKLVQNDRRVAGAGPLVLDARLSAVARAHSQDMLRNGFVGHVSPTTGSAADRLHAAGIGFTVVAENVARAYAPAEAERGLMDSPGHRANLLNRQVTRIGLGIALAPSGTGSNGADGPRELYVTQLFVLPAAPPNAVSNDSIRQAEDEERQRMNLPRLAQDNDLDQLAGRAATLLANGGDDGSAGRLVDDALPALAGRYGQLRTIATVAEIESASTAQVVGEGIKQAQASALGVGVARGVRHSVPSWFVVLLVASPQR